MEKITIELMWGLSILTLLQLTLVASSCLVHYPPNVETAPIYTKTLGRYNLTLPYNSRSIQLSEGEVIQASCRTKFSSISYQKPRNGNANYYGYTRVVLSNQTSISLLCRDSKLNFMGSALEEKVLSCNELKWSIYDAAVAYDWCEKDRDAKTFLFATETSEDHHILAGVCFNLKNWSLQTITYNVTNSGQMYDIEMQRDITKTELKSFQALGSNLDTLRLEYFGLSDNELQSQFVELAAKNVWLNLASYEVSPIVQGVSYAKYFKDYANILNMVWWRNLRLGNWKIFMEALENYAHKNSFQIYTGTSGVVRVPEINVPDKDILELKNGYVNQTVPGYIWSYLISTDNLNKDFIVVGYNSPYSEWFKKSDIEFCPDICSEIPWLQNVTSSFHYAAAGIMFCCSPDFLQQTEYLHGFPMGVLIARANRHKEKAMAIENVANNMLLEGTTTIETTQTTYTTDVRENENVSNNMLDKGEDNESTEVTTPMVWEDATIYESNELGTEY